MYTLFKYLEVKVSTEDSNDIYLIRIKLAARIIERIIRDDSNTQVDHPFGFQTPQGLYSTVPSFVRLDRVIHGRLSHVGSGVSVNPPVRDFESPGAISSHARARS